MLPPESARHSARRRGEPRDIDFSASGHVAREPDSVVPVDALAPFVPLLRLDRKRRDRPGVQALERNRLAGLFAEAVGAILQPPQGGVDLGDQLALAVAGPELQLTLGLGGGAVREVRVRGRLALQVLDGLPALAQDVFLPRDQLAPEVL